MRFDEKPKPCDERAQDDREQEPEDVHHASMPDLWGECCAVCELRETMSQCLLGRSPLVLA